MQDSTSQPVNPDSPVPLQPGIRSRLIPDVNGLQMHVLEAGDKSSSRGRLLLLHGFPELAFSWRHIMLPLAEAGFHVVAPDQRGYGRTTGWSSDYDTELAPFRLMNLVRDALALLHQLGWSDVDAVVGHDFGSPVAAGCALMRPDIFQRVALMSAPFEGPPGFPAGSAPPASDMSLLDEALASLDPPRKHYQYYYTTRSANDDMMSGQLSLHDFLRAYFHVKSADWSGNQPAPLPNWDAQHLGTMPTYYVMNRGENMSDTVAPYLPMTETSQLCVWLPDTDLDFYTAEYSRTGFQGGLNWYRCGLSAEQTQELRLFAGRTIDVPACFIAGRQDWGVYQRPGAFETMQHKACTQMTHVELVDGAGHWVQQEQPEAVVNSLLKWLPGR